MKRIAYLLLTAASAVIAVNGCDGEETTMTGATTNPTTSTTTTGTGGSGGSMNPAAPSLGTLVERMGKPAINTALNAPFEPVAATKDAAKDKWNTTKADAWVATFQAEVEKNLAILDGLDGSCGNQSLAGPMAAAGRYAGLAGALADDRLWLKTDADTCSLYLAVEANATMLAMNADCGGRALPYDVIDMSYSVLAAGNLMMAVGDGVPKPANVDGQTFPYLADPN
jgi:hypothetical protein